MSGLKGRLKTLEKKRSDNYSDILSLIKKGKYFDELTKDQQERYAQYRLGCNRTRFIEVHKALCDFMGIIENPEHVLLEENRPDKEITPEEMEEVAEFLRNPIFDEEN